MLEAIVPLTEEAWKEFSALFTPVRFARKAIITSEGTTEKYLYFVVEGVQRVCFEREGKVHTLVFTYPPSFSGVADSFMLQQPSRWMLEALSSSVLLRAAYSPLIEVVSRHACLQAFLQKALSFALAGALERQQELLSFSAEEKFVTLLRRSPQVLQHIPHKYLASYIGVDPTTFSKMMARVRL
jgi:CRP-like cAMP-binding protein